MRVTQCLGLMPWQHYMSSCPHGHVITYHIEQQYGCVRVYIACTHSRGSARAKKSVKVKESGRRTLNACRFEVSADYAASQKGLIEWASQVLIWAQTCAD